MREANEASKDSTAAEVALTQPPAKGKLLPILVGVNTLMMAGVVAFVLLKTGHSEAQAAPKKSADAEAAEGAPPEEHEEVDEKGAPKKLAGPTVKLDDFVVRLRNPEADRFARVSFEVEVASEKDKERLMSSMARVRDGFIAYLSDRTLEELRGSEAITRTKTVLSERLAQMATGVKIKALYVTDLVIQ